MPHGGFILSTVGDFQAHVVHGASLAKQFAHVAEMQSGHDDGGSVAAERPKHHVETAKQNRLVVDRGLLQMDGKIAVGLRIQLRVAIEEYLRFQIFVTIVGSAN